MDQAYEKKLPIIIRDPKLMNAANPFTNKNNINFLS